MSKNQTFDNHAKFDPMYHFFVAPVFLANLVWSIVRVFHTVSFETVATLFLAVAFFLLAFRARIFALTVQDRVIRLEMRLRMQQVLPTELRARIEDFNVDQLISLRFASDGELPALARKVLDDKVTNRKQIKKMIQDWQPDLLRA